MYALLKYISYYEPLMDVGFKLMILVSFRLVIHKDIVHVVACCYFYLKPTKIVKFVYGHSLLIAN